MSSDMQSVIQQVVREAATKITPAGMVLLAGAFEAIERVRKRHGHTPDGIVAFVGRREVMHLLFDTPAVQLAPSAVFLTTRDHFLESERMRACSPSGCDRCALVAPVVAGLTNEPTARLAVVVFDPTPTGHRPNLVVLTCDDDEPAAITAPGGRA